jgi:hypothetical protein
MVQRLQGFVYFIAGLAVIAAVVFVLVYAVIKDPAVIGSFVTAAGAVGVVVWDRRRQRDQEFTQAHREQMRSVYMNMFKNMSTTQPNVESLRQFQRTFILQGPTAMIRAWLIFVRAYPGDNATEEQSAAWLLMWGAVLLAIRTDLGYDNTGLTGGDLLRLYVTDADVYLIPSPEEGDRQPPS